MISKYEINLRLTHDQKEIYNKAMNLNRDQERQDYNTNVKMKQQGYTIPRKIPFF
jgi:hypothetical protein